MKAVWLYALPIVFSLVIEYGFIHALPTPWSLAPLTISLALYTIFRLRIVPGFVWMVSAGLAADVHAPAALGETLIAAAIGMCVVYLVSQHISHVSWYAACLAVIGVVVLWDALRVMIAFLSGMAWTLSVLDVALEIALALILVTLWFAVLPRLEAAWRRSVRFL